MKAASAMAPNHPDSKASGRLQVLAGGGEGPSDEALCRAFLAGESAAFEALVRRHQLLVYRLMRRYASGRDDALDLSQRAFLKAFEAARRTFPRFGVGAPAPFRAWLVRIALNLGKNHVRQRRRWKTASVELIESDAPPQPTAADALERKEREALARAAIVSLPKRQREVLALRIDGGLAFQEVAEVLGITANNAKVHFHHAVQRLKDQLGTREEG